MKISFYELSVLPSDNRGYSYNHIITSQFLNAQIPVSITMTGNKIDTFALLQQLLHPLLTCL